MFNTTNISNINKSKEMNNNLKNLGDLFNLTLKNEKKSMLQDIATHYQIDQNDLLKRYLTSAPNSDINESSIPIINPRKCLASTKGGRQCSRSRYNSTNFCKSHCKNLPHGTMETVQEQLQTKQPSLVSVELIQNEKVFNRELINGIPYFIDCNNGDYYIEENGKAKKVDNPL